MVDVVVLSSDDIAGESNAAGSGEVASRTDVRSGVTFPASSVGHDFRPWGVAGCDAGEEVCDCCLDVARLGGRFSGQGDGGLDKAGEFGTVGTFSGLDKDHVLPHGVASLDRTEVCGAATDLCGDLFVAEALRGR